ncbi:MAG: hypothetical protein A3F41_01870 [Coxiella sp. RIFCSPHIGHO2_12_FULL_44_14]|nr:MAG: hypothetical protein A3F41_01870 [Coxiella sp. RIFCSPHIGHO2_12_FULL_44_14]
MFKNTENFNSASTIPKKAMLPIYKDFYGQYVILKKLDLEELDLLYEKTHGSDELITVWQYLPYGPFNSPEEMKQFYANYLTSSTKLVFCVHSAKTQEPIGITCLEDINPDMGTIEVASVLYCKSVQKTEANTETVYLLMKHCIQELGYRRIAWRCNSNNEASKRSALRLGFEFEGIFYNHMIVKNGNRDTAWFGLIDQRWPPVSKNLETWLYHSKPEHRGSLFQLNTMVKGYSNVIMKDKSDSLSNVLTH